jgi:hypothetical protein
VIRCLVSLAFLLLAACGHPQSSPTPPAPPDRGPNAAAIGRPPAELSLGAIGETKPANTTKSAASQLREKMMKETRGETHSPLDTLDIRK